MLNGIPQQQNNSQRKDYFSILELDKIKFVLHLVFSCLCFSDSGFIIEHFLLFYNKNIYLLFYNKNILLLKIFR